MGILADSTVMIAAERAGLTPRQIIAELIARHGDTEAALSVVTVLELAHGIERAQSADRRSAREHFLGELLSEMTVEPVTSKIAFRAGRIDGRLHAQGLRVALADLLIGATALELGYAVLTRNVRHFGKIPGLEVIPQE